MKVNNRYILAAVTASMVGLTSCEKDFLDVNQDPNNPPTSTPALTLPAGFGELAYVMGNQFQILGNFWAQHWTQSGGANQYSDLDRYQISTSTYDGRVWGEFYAGALNDFKFVAENAASNESPNYAAIGEIMQAYTYQIITDAWGDVPFSSALMGVENLNPSYDSQEAIYDGLITMLDAAVAKIDNNAPKPGSDDLVFNGNMERWRKFANTLKLRIYLRQAYVRPQVAQAGIQQMYANGAQFLEFGENADIDFYNQTLNRNPIYQTAFVFRGGVDIVASNTSINYLSSTNDPRISAVYSPAELGANAGNIVGVDQGQESSQDRTGISADQLSKPSPRVAGPTSPVPFITAAESYFLQAEAVARGWGNGSADNLYKQGIASSFNYLGLSVSDTSQLTATVKNYPSGGTVEQQVEQIITQKWVSFNGTEGFESWTEYRRTGYPSFLQPSEAALGNIPIPKRIVYPNTEATRNSNYPGLKEIIVPVWWDVKD